MKIGLAEQVRRVDQLSIEKYGISSLELMKNAAAAVCHAVLEHVTDEKTVCILCGKGNNAGDGFALANMLVPHFSSVSVMLLCGNGAFTPDAGYYYELLSDKVCFVEELPQADVYIDAVFGTGFSGRLPEHIRKVFHKVNQTDCLRIAIDVPSGVNCDTGDAATDSFVAAYTVTFEILKRCHVLPNASTFCGLVLVKDIGLSKSALCDVGFTVSTMEDFILPKKSSHLHKGKSGTLFDITGCKQYQGAAALSINAALHSGCGIVTAFVPESIYIPVSVKTNSAIIVPCAENDGGMLSYEMVDKLDEFLKNRCPQAILAGSGLGIGSEIGELIHYILQANVDCVIDGDGLRYVHSEFLRNRRKATVLTPHIGEFARMCECSVQEVLTNRFTLCAQYAKENGVVLVLKDSITLISFPDGTQQLLNAPNPGLAKGGSGDVLAGMIGSFLAQGFTPAQAAMAGVWYHSLAGKITAETVGEYAMLPCDVINHLSVAFQK